MKYLFLILTLFLMGCTGAKSIQDRTISSQINECKSVDLPIVDMQKNILTNKCNNIELFCDINAMSNFSLFFETTNPNQNLEIT